MTTDHDGPSAEKDPIASADNLAEEFKKMTAQIKRVVKRDRRTRHLTIGLAISVFLDLCLSGGFIWQQIVVHDEQVSQCQAGNKARTQDKALWDFVITALDNNNGKPLTGAQDRFYGHLNELVNTKDAQRDCTAIYHGFLARPSASGQ